MPYSATQICNLALAEVPADPIDTLTENSLRARECARVYQPAINELMEAHAWQFATKRVTLALIDNDRLGEWGFAYTMPNGVTVFRKLIADLSTLSGAYTPVIGQTLAAPMSWPFGGQFTDRAPAYPYELAGSTIYTDLPNAILEYASGEGTEATFPPLFVKALYFDIASRVVSPITKDANRRDKLVALAETWKQRAIAADLNRQDSTYDHVPDAIRAM